MQIDFVKLINDAKKEGINRFSTGILVIKQKEVLSLLRKSDDFMPNIHDLPGGVVEKNESLENSLKRELFEETGLKLKKIICYSGYFEYLSSKKERTRQFNFIVEVDKFDQIILSEHQNFIWINEDSLNEIKVSVKTKNIILAYFRNK